MTVDTATSLRHGRGELAVELLRVVQVRLERWRDLLDQRLQLRVLGVREERGVDRVQHLLVVSNLVLDVRLVERGALELLQGLDVLLATVREALRGRVR